MSCFLSSGFASFDAGVTWTKVSESLPSPFDQYQFSLSEKTVPFLYPLYAVGRDHERSDNVIFYPYQQGSTWFVQKKAGEYSVYRALMSFFDAEGKLAEQYWTLCGTKEYLLDVLKKLDFSVFLQERFQGVPYCLGPIEMVVKRDGVEKDWQSVVDICLV